MTYSAKQILFLCEHRLVPLSLLNGWELQRKNAIEDAKAVVWYNEREATFRQYMGAIASLFSAVAITILFLLLYEPSFLSRTALEVFFHGLAVMFTILAALAIMLSLANRTRIRVRNRAYETSPDSCGYQLNRLRAILYLSLGDLLVQENELAALADARLSATSDVLRKYEAMRDAAPLDDKARQNALHQRRYFERSYETFAAFGLVDPDKGFTPWLGGKRAASQGESMPTGLGATEHVSSLG
jgi:hypothetical protein